MMRNLLKKVALALSLAAVSPFALLEIALRATFRKDVFFLAQSQTISLIPGKFGSYIRNAYYHLTLQSCPLDCYFAFGMTFTHSAVSVGHRVYVGSYSMIGMASIGDDSMISDHVHVLSGGRQHSTTISDIPFQRQPVCFSSVSIGNNVWIGTRCVVMQDIGRDCIIGAGSVVNKPLPSKCLAAGVPARVLRMS